MARYKQVLLSRVNSCKSKFSSAEEIADYLRKTYSDYSWKTDPPLLHLVRNALASSSNNNNDETPSKKRKIPEPEPVPKKRFLVLNALDSSSNKSESEDETESDADEEGDERIEKDWTRFKDLVGNEMKEIIKELKRSVKLLRQPELIREYGMKPKRGILLHGPSGCGKSTLAYAVANEAEVPFYPISATDIVSGTYRVFV